MPGSIGMPTIWDKDLLIFAATLIRQAMNQGKLGSENRHVKIDSWNFFAATSKGDGAQQFKSLTILILPRWLSQT
jgi:plasmid replication initiation protein